MRKLTMSELGRMEVEQFKSAPKSKMSVALDNVRSLYNVGSVFRSADAFRVAKIYLGGITAQPPHRDIRKTALGASESVDWEHCADLYERLKNEKAAGKIILGVEQVEPKTLLKDFQVDPKQEYILVFGNEVDGIDERILPLLDAALEIPQHGTKHSFNISVSVGIVLWELANKGLGV